VSQGERAALQARYRELLERVRGLGFAVPGSVIERYTGCAAPGCHCHDDPPVKHGPYLQYTRKLAGKTTSRRLDPEQVERYREWIADRIRLDDLLDQWTSAPTITTYASETSAGRRSATVYGSAWVQPMVVQASSARARGPGSASTK